MSFDDSGFRGLRLKFYMEIMDFERLCSFLNKIRNNEMLYKVFPWFEREKNATDLGPLPPLEESLREFEQEFGDK